MCKATLYENANEDYKPIICVCNQPTVNGNCGGCTVIDLCDDCRTGKIWDVCPTCEPDEFYHCIRCGDLVGIAERCGECEKKYCICCNAANVDGKCPSGHTGDTCECGNSEGEIYNVPCYCGVIPYRAIDNKID
jgi:hypothetical protein